MSIQFHETRMGVRFFERDLPELIRAINRLADALEAKATQPEAAGPCTTSTSRHDVETKETDR